MNHVVLPLFALGLLFLCMGPVEAQPTPVKAIHTWAGSVADEQRLKQVPENGVIADARTWEQLIASWKIVATPKQVNFAKELVLVATSSGSKLDLQATLDENGDLKAIGVGTRDFLPGFRYVLISVSKEKVRSVNGKKLPK